MMRLKMIGNKGAMRILVAIIIILVLFFAAFWTYEELKYSWKINREMNDNNATCYLERGVFKFPLARVCTYNNTFIVEKTQVGPNMVSKLKNISQEKI